MRITDEREGEGEGEKGGRERGSEREMGQREGVRMNIERCGVSPSKHVASWCCLQIDQLLLMNDGQRRV